MALNTLVMSRTFDGALGSDGRGLIRQILLHTSYGKPALPAIAHLLRIVKQCQLTE